MRGFFLLESINEYFCNKQMYMAFTEKLKQERMYQRYINKVFRLNKKGITYTIRVDKNKIYF